MTGALNLNVILILYVIALVFVDYKIRPKYFRWKEKIMHERG